MAEPSAPGDAGAASVAVSLAAPELLRLREGLRVAQLEIDRLSRAGAGELPLLREANEQLALAVLGEQQRHSALEHAMAKPDDPLTGLAGRDALLARFDDAIATAKGTGEKLGVLFLDLDGFKGVNTSLGHRGGDAVLRHVAHCLDATVRGDDMVSRHGGDEFVVLLTQLRKRGDAARVARKILARLMATHPVGDQLVRVSASIGVSMFPDDGQDPLTLIHHADGAMYRAKGHGRPGYRFHDPGAARAAPAETPLPVPAPAPAPAGPARTSPAPADATLLQARLQEANEQLLLAAMCAQELQRVAEQAHADQTARLALVAHELRNPLMPIRMAASLLDRVGTLELPRLRGVIERQVDHVSRLVGDLLDLSRVNAGKLRIELAEVDVCAVIAEVVETCRSATGARNQRLHATIPTGPLLVRGDRMRLVQVLSNLLDNASKYTPVEGTITIGVVGSATDIVVTVADTGIGISPEALATVFHPFVQETHATTFNGAGLGIGLAVVRELVEAHGGSVHAASAGAGQGSRFVLAIPRLAVADAA